MAVGYGTRIPWARATGFHPIDQLAQASPLDVPLPGAADGEPTLGGASVTTLACFNS